MLAVLMIVPMFVSCGGKTEGTEVEVANVKVYRYNDTTATATTEIHSGSVVAVVAEGAALTLKDVVLGFDPNAYYDESTSRFVKISEYSADAEWFWNYTVNGAPANIFAEIQPTDTIEIVYEPLNKTAPATAEAAA